MSSTLRTFLDLFGVTEFGTRDSFNYQNIARIKQASGSSFSQFKIDTRSFRSRSMMARLQYSDELITDRVAALCTARLKSSVTMSLMLRLSSTGLSLFIGPLGSDFLDR
jgi:hypothetical protein